MDTDKSKYCDEFSSRLDDLKANLAELGRRLAERDRSIIMAPFKGILKKEIDSLDSYLYRIINDTPRGYFPGYNAPNTTKAIVNFRKKIKLHDEINNTDITIKVGDRLKILPHAISQMFNINFSDPEDFKIVGFEVKTNRLVVMAGKIGAFLLETDSVMPNNGERQFFEIIKK